MKNFTVYVRQEYEPIEVKATDKDEAEHRVRNHVSWGEPIDVEITVEEDTND